MAGGVQTSSVFVGAGVVVQAKLVPIGPGSSTTQKSILTYYGFSIREANGTPGPATVRFRENSGAGEILEEIELASDASARQWYGPQGRRCNGDIFVEVVAGVVEGVVFYG